MEGDASAVSVVTSMRSGRVTCRPSFVLKPWLARKQLCHVHCDIDPIPWVPGPPGSGFPARHPSKETMAWVMKQEGVARRLEVYECSRQWKRKKNQARFMKEEIGKKKMKKMKDQDVGQQVSVIAKDVPDEESTAE